MSKKMPKTTDNKHLKKMHEQGTIVVVDNCLPMGPSQTKGPCMAPNSPATAAPTQPDSAPPVGGTPAPAAASPAAPAVGGPAS